MAELSAACSRAARSRRVCRGGRPRQDDQPERSLKAYGRDLDVIKRYAMQRGISIKQAVNLFANALVNGAKIPARPDLAPDGWRLFR